MLLYLYWSDIYVAVQYWKNGEFWWFGATLIYTYLHSFTDCKLHSDHSIYEHLVMYNGYCSVIYCCSLHRSTCRTTHKRWRFPPYLLACNTSLYRDNHGKRSTMVSSSLHHVSSAVLPIVHRGLKCVSLLSLAWSIMTLEKERKEKNNLDFDRTDVFVFSLKQSLTLVPRLFRSLFLLMCFDLTCFLPLQSIG